MENALGVVDRSVNFLNYLLESHKRRKDLPDGIDYIKKEQLSIKIALSDLSRTPDQERIHFWTGEQRAICRKIENCVELHNLKIRHELGGVRGRIHHLKTTRFRNKLVAEIEAIKKLVDEANERVNKYHLQQVAGQIVSIRDNSVAAIRHANLAHPDGLETHKAELLSFLAPGDGKTKKLRVIPVDGLGGSGKTVLAKASYKQVKHEFDCKAWVSASDDVHNILKDILGEFCVQIP